MFYNCHTHIFRDVDVPNNFLPFGLVKILRTKLGYGLITRLMRNILPFTDRDMLDRFAQFLKTGRMKTQEEIFIHGWKSYSMDTKFIILPMDMNYMAAGPVPREYAAQIDELAELKKKYPDNIIPFFHVDPRRVDVIDSFKEAVEQKGFKGLKLYPPLGYFPYDKRLDKIYEYCQEKNIPVLVHCSPFNAVRYKGSKKAIRKLLKKGNPNIKNKHMKGLNAKKLCSLFAHPMNYLTVIKKFPKLRICFAHFGSSNSWDMYLEHGNKKNNWFTIIKKLIVQHPNFYTDISFTLNDKRYFPILKDLLNSVHVKNMREKILFGSDYYMVEQKSDEKRFGKELRKYIGEDNFQAIAVKNPEKFLG